MTVSMSSKAEACSSSSTRGCDDGSGATGMMVTVRVADSGGSGARAPAGCGAEPREENFGAQGPKRPFFASPQSRFPSLEILQNCLPKAAKSAILPFVPRRPLAVGLSSCLSCCGCGCCPCAGSTPLVLSGRTTCRQLLEQACAMHSPHCHDALGVFAWRVLCGSTALRRGAARYGDGCEYFFGRSRLISLLLFAVLGLSSRLTWHDFAYVTMAQKVPSSTLVYPLYPNPSFLERSGPHIPVAQDPSSQPRACGPWAQREASVKHSTG